MRTNTTTAAQVRAFYMADENRDRLNALSAAAQKTVVPVDGKSPKGRLHPDVRADYNSDHKGKAAYVEGTPRTAPISYRRTQPSGRTVKAEANLTEAEQRALAITLGVEGVGTRGPLPKAARAAISEHLTRESAQAVASGE